MTIEAPEIVETETARVACDGGQGALGHPRVWLSMGKRASLNAPIATVDMC